MKFPSGSFDAEQVAILQEIYDKTCKELGLGANDTDWRNHIADSIMELAKTGEFDSERLLIAAIQRFNADRRR